MATRSTYLENDFVELDLGRHFVVSDGLIHLPAGTLCGPLQIANLGTKWGYLEVSLSGPGPFDLPQLIVAASEQDQQNIAISLKFKRNNQDGSVSFGTPVSRQRLDKTLYLIASLRNCAVTKIESRVSPLTESKAARIFAAGILKRPILILKSGLKQNKGYCFQDWPKHSTPKDRFRSIIELATRNFPNPDDLQFGQDPEYTFWSNHRFGTLIPRRMIDNGERTFPLHVGVMTKDGKTDTALYLTLNSLLSANIPGEMISVISDQTTLQLPHGIITISETAHRERLTYISDDSFLMILNSGDCVSRDFLDTCQNNLDKLQISYAYLDHDRVSPDGTYCQFEFKPDCSPNYLLFHNYPSGAAVVRMSHLRDLFKKLPALALIGINAAIYACAIDASQNADTSVIHVAVPSIHLANKTSTLTSSDLAEDQKSRELLLNLYAPNLTIEPSNTTQTNWHSKNPRPPKISILIPTKNRIDLLKPAIDSISNHTKYPNYEIVIINNQSDDEETISYLEHLARQGTATVTTFDEQFNFARMHNQLVPQLTTEYVLMMNNDTEVFDSLWLTKLVDLFELPNLGIVGNKLIYPDGTIQHMGAIGGLKGPMAHPFSGADDAKENPLLAFPRDVLGVTGACLLIPQRLYIACEGMDEKLAVSFNDMDLCLSVRVNLRKAVIVSSSGGVIHKESRSRGTRFSKEHQDLLNAEADYFNSKWLNHIRPDPFYNPNLSLNSAYKLQ
ncbi:MAG: glycosyltransferase [Acidimicrobiaceae bacterium]|nr:glycosyltransferase [Acidimicrobiaceae bacterium]